MAKKSSVERDKKRRRMTDRYAAKRAQLKAMAEDRTASLEERFEARLKLAALPRNSSKTRVHNRCEVSGRSKAYYRKLGVSRIALRQLASDGKIPGMVKSSW